MSIIDVRCSKAVSTATLFDSGKDVYHEWMGADKLVFAGYKGRDRVFQSIDKSSLTKVISNIHVGSGSGVPHVKYDHDTRMLFLYSKVCLVFIN